MGKAFRALSFLTLLVAASVGSSDPATGQSTGFAPGPDLLPYNEVIDLDRAPGGGIVALVGTGRCDGSSGCSVSSRTLVRLGASGEIDSSFGGGDGIANPGGPLNGATSLDVQADGRIVVAGPLAFPGTIPQDAIYFGRYLPDGAVDTTFALGGAVGHSVGVGVSLGEVRETASGKIVAVGSATEVLGEGGDTLVMRLETDGDLDETWAGDGILVIDPAGSGTTYNSSAHATTEAPDGDLLVTGERYCASGCVSGLMLLRLGPDGSLDGAFGTGGVAAPLFTGGSLSLKGSSIALAPDGGVVVGGTDSAPIGAKGPPGSILVRYLASGQLDQTFGDGDAFLTDSICGGGIRALAVAATGEITAGSRCASRYSASGSILTRSAQPAYFSPEPRVSFLHVDSTGEALGGGSSQTYLRHGLRRGASLAVSQVLSDGTRDRSFGQRGTAYVPPIPTCRGRLADVFGSSGDDRLIALDFDSVIAGLDGSDSIVGGEKADLICGGRGADRIDARGQSDRVHGGSGPDRIRGGFGADSIFGNKGPDRILGEDGADALFGGPGRDVLRGGPGRDGLVFGSGQDRPGR